MLLALDPGSSYERRAGILQYAREAGWILDGRFMAYRVQNQHKSYLASMPFDGVISWASRFFDELLPVFKSMRVPIVDLGHDYPEWPVPRVLLDHRAAGAMGAGHLVGLGVKSLLFYSHTVDRRVARIRGEAFIEKAKAYDVDVRELWWEPRVSARKKLGRIAWLAGQLAALPRPLGVLAVNDVVAAEVIDAAEHAGLQVPGDIAVLGIDNDPVLTELGAVPLSSIDIARERVGYEAAALLDRLMDGEKPPREPILVAPAGVVTRRSTETLAVADPDVALAAKFIREHFREPITVADVAAHALLSRRRLQDKFLAAVGHGMSDEITRQRLEFSKHLLTQTNHKIAAISTMAGFGSVHRMSKVFRRVLHDTPQTYRRKYQPVRTP